MPRKVQLIKRLPYFKSNDNEKNRDTRNLVKNIIKLLVNWLLIKDEQWDTSYSDYLRNMCQKTGFNNRLILEIAEDEIMKRLFSEFIEKDAEKYITNSKIKDKDSHLSAIKTYEKIFIKNSPKSSVKIKKR